MGITKGTVMDKVTNIFSSSHSSESTIMGNNVNKEKSGGEKEERGKPDINGINIPKVKTRLSLVNSCHVTYE